jgi:acylpyruvate hydrolase
MRLATIRHNGSRTAVRMEGAEAITLPFADVRELLASGSDWHRRAEGAGGESLDSASLDYAPIVPAPEKIVCVGLNYRDHAKEAGLPLPDHPMLFAKYSRSLIGANDDIMLPFNSDMVDWEVELGVVIGREARHVTAGQARDHIAGYTIVNDVSMRDWQRRTSQFLQGKTFEASTPAGPHLVTLDEVGDPAALDLGCSVDDVTMQDSNTRQLIFSADEIVAYLSSIVTLVPGDLIATGTPHGVGAGRTPAVFLETGNVVRSWVQGLGEQRNQCSADQVPGAEAVESLEAVK